MKTTTIVLLLPALLAPLAGRLAAEQPDQMAQHHQMMARHEEIGKLIDRLQKSFAVLENEKDPVQLKKELAEHGALLKELQTSFEAMPKMMGKGMTAVAAEPLAGQATAVGGAGASRHFALNTQGGVIGIEASNLDDPVAADEIREQLAQLARTGVTELQRFRADIDYVYMPTAGGGELRIESRNDEALNAIHEYLRLQIRELQTGDSEDIRN